MVTLYNAMGIDLPTEPPFGPDPPPDSRRHILFGAAQPDQTHAPTPIFDLEIRPA